MAIDSSSRYSTISVYYAPGRDASSVVEVVGNPIHPQVSSARTNVSVASAPIRTRKIVWRQGDRMDTLAHHVLGDATSYWQIMDLNPTVFDATTIPPGTLITVPRV